MVPPLTSKADPIEITKANGLLAVHLRASISIFMFVGWCPRAHHGIALGRLWECSFLHIV